MKTETIVLVVIAGAAVAAGAVYYAKQKQLANNPQIIAQNNGNPNSRSAPVSQSQEIAGYVGIVKDVTAQVGDWTGGW